MKNEDDFNELDLIDQEDKCSGCKKKAPQSISFFMHENSLMHKDIDNERAHKTSLFVCITFIIITVIFVVAYTLRMNSFINLIKEMNAVIVQLANAKGMLSP